MPSRAPNLQLGLAPDIGTASSRPASHWMSPGKVRTRVIRETITRESCIEVFSMVVHRGLYTGFIGPNEQD